MSWFSFGKKDDSKGPKRTVSQLVVSSEDIGPDGKPVDANIGGAKVDWNTAFVLKWAGQPPTLSDRLFLSPGVSALVNWAFNDSEAGDHFGFSRMDGPYGGRFIEVCKATNPSVPSEQANADSLKADIYFLSLSGTYNVRFGIGDVRVIEPELPDHPGVPTSVRGEYMIGIGDVDAFIRLNRLQNFNISQLLDKIRVAIEAVVVRAVSRAPLELGIPLSQINSVTLELSQRVQMLAGQELQDHFGVVLKKVLLKAVEVDLGSPEYTTVFELLGSKGQKAAELKSAAELERLRSRLNAETRLHDVDLDNKVEMAELLSGVESAKARDTASEVYHEIEKNRATRVQTNEIDEIRRELELEKEKASRLHELEMMSAQLETSSRVRRSELDQQSELAELKAKLESMKASSVIGAAQHDYDSMERERSHQDALLELRRQQELQVILQDLNIQQQRYLVGLHEIEAEITSLQRSDATADAKQQADIAKMMIELRTIADNAIIDVTSREREMQINLSDIEDLKRRHRELYHLRTQLETQHEFSDAHGRNIDAQIRLLEVKLQQHKLESERLKVASAVTSTVTARAPQPGQGSQEHSTAVTIQSTISKDNADANRDSTAEASKRVTTQSNTKLYSLRTADGKINDYTASELMQLINLNVIDNVHHPTLPPDHKLRLDP